MKVLIGFTGSVATILAEKLVVAVMEKGHEVRVILTECGDKILPLRQRWKISDTCSVYVDKDEWRWEEIHTPNSGYRDQWLKDDPVLHIELRKWADVLLIAPLSANTLGKIANGLCDNLLTCVVRAWDWSKPCIVAPAMNTFMWESPITAQNLQQVKIYGSNFIVVPPISKELACGDDGMGAMARIETVVNYLSIRKHESESQWKILKVGEIVKEDDERWETPEDNPSLDISQWCVVPSIAVDEQVQPGEKIRRLKTA